MGGADLQRTERERKSALIALVDAAHPPPELRARKVLDSLRQDSSLDTWDVLCFCVEYLGMMSAVWPWLTEDAKRVAKLVYIAHYEHFGTELPQEARTKL